MKFVTNIGRTNGGRILLSTAAAALLATTAAAHDGDHWPLTGDQLKMKSSLSGQSNKFLFKTKGQVNINAVSIAQDPTADGATLMVRGTGAFAANSGIVHLNASRWSPIGPDDAPTGWKFKGDGFFTDGVSKVQIKTGKTSGSLKIQAKGPYWPLDILGPQDSIEIVLSIGGFAFCAEFSPARLAEFSVNDVGQVTAKATQAPGGCPDVCGNGILEDGEQCDDANFVDTDTCSNSCLGCNPADAEFDTTFEGIQELIFDNPVYDCTNDICHGAGAEAGLDLRAGNSYADLVGVDSSIQPSTKRVFPGDQDLSMLYLKIAKKTLGTAGVPGTAMPPNSATVTEEHLEALRLWIRGGAPENGVVAGTAQLLGSCLPEPTPLDIPQPPIPDPTVGTQFPMPGYNLVSQTEIEGCVASYYDVSATVPANMKVPCPGAFPGTNDGDECFSYNGNELFQDAQSHHSIVQIYTGAHDQTDPGWGSWRCYGGPTPDAACDPTAADPCDGANGGVCGSAFHHGVACVATSAGSWGPADFNATTTPQFSGSQESTASLSFPNGVYNVLPLKGLIVWNSHAFNLTSQDTAMEAWINIAYTDQRTWPAIGLFNNNWIFTQNVPPFQQREYCATHTFDEGTRLFQLSSHTHKRGIRWRYYSPPQTACSAPGGSTNPACLPGNADDIFYESYDYSDPLVLDSDPPIHFTGTPANRTIKFCALYDNGFTNADKVKTKSGSPTPTGNLIFGGPCSASETACMGGINKGALCNGSDANCPGSTCDACPLRGGVTTEDEMYIAIGTYYIDP
ncbi:MAG: DUF4215 domain-containing protein [Candidatus Binatia bacterium]